VTVRVRVRTRRTTTFVAFCYLCEGLREALQLLVRLFLFPLPTSTRMVSTGSDCLEGMLALKTDVSATESALNTGTPQEVKKKRKRVTSACIYCQRSHMSCDESRPCKRCVSRGMSELCRDGKRRRRGRKRKSDVLVADDDDDHENANSKESDDEEKYLSRKERRLNRARVREARETTVAELTQDDVSSCEPAHPQP
jgi:hypothetical protein